MVAKAIWDTAVYWAVPGLLYFHDKFRDLEDCPGVILNLARISTLSEHIQAFFREWYAIDQSNDADTFIKFYDFDFMERLHIGMTEELPGAKLEAQFAANVDFVEQLAGQLASTVIGMFADRQDDEMIQNQVQQWRANQFLTEMIAHYQQACQEHPIDGRWITLGRPIRERQETAR